MSMHANINDNKHNEIQYKENTKLNNKLAIDEYKLNLLDINKKNNND